MPLYHIYVVEAGERRLAPQAVELPNDESAKLRARQLAEGLRLSPGFGIRHREDCHVDVTDAKGKWIVRCHGNRLSIGSTPGRSRTQQRLRA